MRLIVGNIETHAVVGGKDFLLEFDIMEKMRSYLRVRVDGYQHVDAFKEHKWDGYRYFITLDGKFATGFLPLVANYLEEFGVNIQVEDIRAELPELIDGELDADIGQIDGEIWTGRDYQVNMVTKLRNWITVGGQRMYFPRGMYDCATNAGKNSIAAMIVMNMKRQYRTLFLVASQEIFDQAVSFFSQVLDEKVGEIKSGKFVTKWFTVAMVKTLYSQAKKSMNVKKMLSELEAVIVDESDEAGADEYSKCLQLVGAGMRIFVSGTPLEASSTNNMVAVGLSGKILGTISNKYLIDNGYSQKPKVSIYLNVGKAYSFDNYATEVSRNVYESESRAHKIYELIRDNSEKVIMVSFWEKKHGYFMYEYCRKLLPNIDIGIVHGTSPDRFSQMENFKKGKTSVLFASMIVKRGVNMPGIRMLIMGHGGKSVIVQKQLVGRALRHDGINDDVEICDFYDTGKHLGKHSTARLKIYKKEEFHVELKYPNRKGKPIL